MSHFYKIIISYDGSSYGGWQRQQHDRTVAGTLEETFYRTFYLPARVIGASRTDAGVHALGQVASVVTDLLIEPGALKKAWNNALPHDIVIRSVEVRDRSFSVFKSVLSKTYYYHVFLERPLPFLARYGYFYRFPVVISKLQSALSVFTGTHNFRSFCTGDDRGTDTIRTIDVIMMEYIPRYRVYRIVVVGEKFLRYMIRRIVGAALAVGTERSQQNSSDLIRILGACNPSHCLPTAPAQGLVLRKIIYKSV